MRLSGGAARMSGRAGEPSPGCGKGLIFAGPLRNHGTNCMSDKRFVDTNILVYAHDRSKGAKHSRARALIEELWNSGLGVISTQVLQELCVNLRRKCDPPLSADETRSLIQDYSGWDVVVNTPESVLQALELESQHRISFWDALILQAAESAGAEILYSEDLSHRQRYGTIRVINPLISVD
jgi:predicted nucleic acid-binding protein